MIGYMIGFFFALTFAGLIVSWFFTPDQWCARHKVVETFEDQSVGFGRKEKVPVYNHVCVDIQTGTSPAYKTWKFSVDFIKQRW